MNLIDVYYIKNKKIKFIVYLMFYFVWAITGMFCFKNAVDGCFSFEENINKILINLSLGLSCLTFSTGFFFFLGYDFYEKKIFNIIGFCIMMVLTILHFTFNCLVGIITFEAFLLGCPDGYGWIFGLATASHLYVIFVRKIYRITIDKYVGESKKMLIQMLFPFACFLIMSFFISFSLGFLCILLMAVLFMDMSSNRKIYRTKKLTNKQTRAEETKRAAFGNDEEIKY